MKISDLENLKGFRSLQDDYEDVEVSGGYTSDLLSDVMANADEGSVLITIQAHKNTVAVASLAGIVALVVCNNRSIDDETLATAAREGLAVFQTSENQFNTSATIAQHLEGCPAR